jgi:hypothetical protein
MTTLINASTSSGLVVTSDNSGIIALQSNGTTKATLGPTGFSYPGAVLQVLQYTYTSTMSVATGSYIATPLTLTITPSSTSSKILVRAVLHVGMTGGNEGAHGRLYRNGSVITGAIGDASSSRDRAWFHCGSHYTGYEQYSSSPEYLDSPNTTSATTYTVYVRAHSASYPFYINSNEADNDADTASRTVSTITLMEIAQ